MADPRQAYSTLIARLDAFFERVQQRYPQAVRCGSGCADCCGRDLSLLPFEIERLLTAAAGLAPDCRQRVLERAWRAQADAEAGCALLEDDRCLVYPARSVICRTHGLPCLIENAAGKPELSICPYNFDGLQRVDGDCVLDLEPVNQALATINHLDCSARGAAPERMRISRALIERLGGEGPA